MYMAIFGLIGVPMVAEGSVLSRMASFFSGERPAVDGGNETYSSQTLPLLKGAYNVDPNPSKGGGDIIVVSDSALRAETGPAGSMANIEDAPKSGQISLYVVREGDSLSQIAHMFGVSPNTILWANNLARGSAIVPGQELLILPINGVQYTVKKGDTLASIAKKYKGNEEEIITYNHLDSASAISVGDILTIPGGEIEVPKPVYASVGSKTPSYAGYYIHPVLGAIKTQGIHGYNGVDFGARVGASVRASAGGKILVSRTSGWNGGYGNYIVVEHANGTQTLYAHLSGNIVYAGQQVVQGQVIGYVGNTGRSTGPHLHFEVRGAKNPF